MTMNKLPMDVDDDGKWSRTCIRIFGETLQPEEIEAKLGLKATRTHVKGQPRSRRYNVPWRHSLWLLESPLSDDHDMADHLKWLLDRLEPRLDVIRTLSAEYRVGLMCGFSSGSGQGGFTLDSTTLGRTAKLGVPLVVDLYPPGFAEDDRGRLVFV